MLVNRFFISEEEFIKLLWVGNQFIIAKEEMNSYARDDESSKMIENKRKIVANLIYYLK